MHNKRHKDAYRKLSTPDIIQGKPSPQPQNSYDSRLENTRNPYSHHTVGYIPKDNNRRATKKSQHRQKNKYIYFLILFLLIVIFIYAAYQITVYIIHTNQARHAEQLVADMIIDNEPINDTPVTTETDDKQVFTTASPVLSPSPSQAAGIATVIPTETPKPEVLIQFTQALAVNPDTVGQLEMGESINTYVVQRDNSYYLRHSFYGEYSFSGAIFLDITCSIYPQSRNLIIHGHNMQNGTSFGKLSRFDSVDYLNQYPFIHFSTLYESADYRPFAVVYYSVDPESDDYLNLYRVNYLSDDDFIQFVRDIQLRSVYRIPVSIAKTDNILTITTCATDNPDFRFAVFAVKLKDQ